jgi:hypothetical protein
MNLKLEKRDSNGLQFQGNYTWSKFIDDVTSRGGLGAGPSFINYYDRGADRGLSTNHLAHRFIWSSVWEVPVGKDRMVGINNSVLNQIIGGWSLGYIAEFRTGTPYAVREQTNRTNSFSDGNRPNVVGNPVISGDRSTAEKISQWFNTAAFAQPADFTFGNAGATSGFTPGSIAMDISILKNFQIAEGHVLQFRAEMLNFPNHANFGTPNTNRGNANFGTITTLAPGNQARITQFGLRYSF